MATKTAKSKKLTGKQRYAERKAKGICVTCGVRKAVPGRVECAFEIEAAKAHNALKRAGKGKEWNIDNFRRTVAGKLALEENKLTTNGKATAARGGKS